METNPVVVKRRLEDIRKAADQAYKSFSAGKISGDQFNAIMTRAERDQEALTIATRTRKKAMRYAGGADNTGKASGPYGWGFDPPEDFNPKVAFKKWRAPSAKDLTQTQVKSLFEAGRSGMRFSTHVGTDTKDAGSWSLKDYAPSNPVAEGSPGSLLPPELMWIPEAWYLRYEPVRIIEYFVKAPLGDTQSAAWLKHYGNSSPAAVVPELQLKPDLGPLVEQFTAAYSTIAATASVSKQLFDDWEQLGATLPHEIQAAIIDEENQQVLNGNGEDSNMLGIFNQPDTLTRVSPTITSTAYTAIDVLVDAITDIRVNNAYAEADLIILNPEDWNAIRRIKNTLGSFVLNANAAMQAGEVDNVFGVPVVSTTTCPVGKAVVMDTKIGALAFPRTGLEIMFNPYGDWAFTHNAVQFRGEIRETIGVAYPTAINLVSNINYEAGGPFS